ncbi:hypothetical protein E2C01_029200 [Portunus trituberculatus]|uniref:Uncharacterized protein n=1 Tax=Portunus trituberculatus TaxID=210409 RepID=A0A5B7EQV0_PORTR|nr:hypothetical protein [Portunus trituberculatus]
MCGCESGCLVGKLVRVMRFGRWLGSPVAVACLGEPRLLGASQDLRPPEHLPGIAARPNLSRRWHLVDEIMKP